MFVVIIVVLFPSLRLVGRLSRMGGCHHYRLLSSLFRCSRCRGKCAQESRSSSGPREGLICTGVSYSSANASIGAGERCAFSAPAAFPTLSTLSIISLPWSPIPFRVQVKKELGERRQADRGPASIAFGEEVVGDGMNRDAFVVAMEQRVRDEYAKLDKFHKSGPQ